MNEDKGFVIVLVGGMALVAIVVLVTNFCTSQALDHDDLKPFPQETR